MSASEFEGLQAFPEELSGREAWLEPFDWYAEMRSESPVRYDPGRATWDVFRYDDVKAVLDDDDTFSTNPRNIAGFEEPEEGGFILETMLQQDPPRHDELRSVVNEAFEPRAIADLEPRIRELTEELLDEALADADGRFDVVDALAYPLPVIVIAELLGVPPEERDQFKTWSDTMIQGAAGDTDAEAFQEQQRQAGMEMANYFVEKIEARREEPRDDLLTTIATAEGEAGRLSHTEALGTCMLLLIAGNITTTNLITNAVRCFDEHERDLFAELGDDERALSTAMEEVLRYRSPVQAMDRVPTETVELGGETLEPGDRMVVWLGSANRDPETFSDPDTFRPDRTPNQHLAFGHGTHYCLGAPLARLEGKVAMDVLTDRLSGIEVADVDLQPVRSSFIYGVESLPITVEESA